MNQEEQWLLKEKYGRVESEAFHADCARLASGEPLGYVIEHVPFLDCVIHLDSKPLIPRVETEYWTELAIKEIVKFTPAESTPEQTDSSLAKQRLWLGGIGWGSQGDAESGLNQSAPPLRILDLCAGSGAVGVAIAKALPNAHVTFGEIDVAHIKTITKNCEENGLTSERFNVVASDLFENISGTYDFILTNPPYIDPALDRAEVSVKMHEPHLALYGGLAGMEVIESIVDGARAKLAPGAQLWIEHEPEQTAAIATLAASAGFLATTKKDQYEVERYSILVLQ